MGDIALEVGYAMAKHDHLRLGYDIADERIQYPKPLTKTWETPKSALA